MKLPQTPPETDLLWNELIAGQEPWRIAKILSSTAGPTTRGKYLHWDKLSYYQPPNGLTTREWWLAIKNQRRTLFKQVPLFDKQGRPFQFIETDPLPEQLYALDIGASGQSSIDDQLQNPATREKYMIGAVMEEAITSSQLEGATTTRKIARVMLQEGRAPRDSSERMIFNNYQALRQIDKIKEECLTRELVFDIHRRVTDKTLADSSATGRFRLPHEQIAVRDSYGQVYHEPPSAEQLEERIGLMCAFANAETPEFFIHPVIRAIILHFWLAYDHPFVDGNGRTARALFYWAMLHHGYWLFEYVSISQVILKAPSQYAKAFLYTETDDNDLTYFILYHMEVITQAIETLKENVKRDTERKIAVERKLQGLLVLNDRQRALVHHALRHPTQQYTVYGHQARQKVVYETARTDMLNLAERGLLEVRKIGKTWVFTPVSDIEEKLEKMV